MPKTAIATTKKSSQLDMLLTGLRTSLLGASGKLANLESEAVYERVSRCTTATSSRHPSRKSELKTSDVFLQLRRSDLDAHDVLVYSEASNPLYRPTPPAGGEQLPTSFEQAVYETFDALLDYARSQRQEESLAFWLAVEDYKQYEQRQGAPSSPSPREAYVNTRKRDMTRRAATTLQAEIGEYARDIYCEFLEEDSPSWVSLNEPVMRELHGRLGGEVDAQCFDDAQKLVFQDMKTNLYPGYLKWLRHQGPVNKLL